MSTQKAKQFRNTMFSAFSLLGILLPLNSLAPINPVMATPKHNKPVPTTQPTKQPTQTTYMESYNFSYSYKDPIANGVPVTEGYLGTGFVPVGTYQNGQIIPVLDAFGRPHGTYTIGSVSNQVPYDGAKLNTVSVFEYDINNQRYTLTNGSKGAVIANNSTGGLGSEHGSLTLGGSFTNQNPAFPAQAAHW